MQFVVKFFPEITIKSKPVRRRFVSVLLENLKSVVREVDPAVEVKRGWDKFQVYTEATDPEILARLVERLRNTSGIRRPGAAALDLCYVACGRLDGFWETGLAPWDLAAGTLIIREAGGIVSALDGGENHLETGHVLAGTPKVYRELAKLCSKEIKDLVG